MQLMTNKLYKVKWCCPISDVHIVDVTSGIYINTAAKKGSGEQSNQSKSVHVLHKVFFFFLCGFFLHFSSRFMYKVVIKMLKMISYVQTSACYSSNISELFSYLF